MLSFNCRQLVLCHGGSFAGPTLPQLFGIQPLCQRYDNVARHLFEHPGQHLFGLRRAALNIQVLSFGLPFHNVASSL